MEIYIISYLNFIKCCNYRICKKNDSDSETNYLDNVQNTDFDTKRNFKKKVKLCHFVNGIANGGVEQVIINYFSNIDRSQYELHIVTQGRYNDEKCLEKFKKMGFIIHNVRRKKETFVGNFIDIMKILKKERFDIIHCHMTTTNFFPLFYGLMCGVKVRISHSHLASQNAGISIKILNMLSSVFATDKFACGTEAAKFLFGNTKNVTIVNNAIKLENFTFDNELRKEKRNDLKLTNKIVIGHVGRFVSQKNHEFIIDLFNEIYQENNNYCLMLVGTGELEQKIREKVKKMNLEECVYFMGARDDVNELMQVMDIFILPSLYEGLPVVLIEAQASGLKCFCSDKIDKEIKITNNIKFLNLNVDDWKKEILLNSKYVRKNYYKKITDNGFNINYEVKKLDNLYHQMFKR